MACAFGASDLLFSQISGLFMHASFARRARKDMADSFRQFDLALFLAWEDIRQRYVRTMLGPLWIVLSTGIWFGLMGFVMANLFQQKLEDYFPFLISGLLIWVLISTSISESAQVLVSAAPLISTFSIPIFTHFLRFVMRNYIIFFHNLIILVLVFLFYPPHVTVATWLVLPGLALDMIILLGLSVFLSLANLRYRDTHLAVASAMQVLPFLTPIFWDRSMLKTRLWVADFNPFYHMIEIVRGPLLGKAPLMMSWYVAIGMAVCLCGAGCVLFMRYRHRIIFWL